MNKKIFRPDGKFFGIAMKIEKDGNDILVTMPGDLPGMLEKTIIFSGGEIVYEDNDRIYIDYQWSGLVPLL